MIHKTVAVIGHVDHGKTGLVKALTGIDTDTLAEEKQRGLSITLGFAHRAFPSGQVHLVDAPGHADFLRMTASGLSGADAILLVVSAKDGVQTQTREHAKLAELFGIERAVVAVTKSDIATDEDVATATRQVATLLDPHGFDPMQIIACSSVSGMGLSALCDALSRICEESPQRPDLKGFYLPIDRVFSAPGAGTIVTGTLLGAAIGVDDEIILEPGRRTASVRAIQIAGADHARAMPGARIAINLRGIDTTSIRRGQVVCAPDDFSTSHRFDVALMPGPGLKHMEQVTVLQGTAHGPARVRLYPATDSEYRYAQLEFPSSQIAYPGQRFVLHRPATSEILTGGIVIDPGAPLITRNKPAHVTVLHALATGDLNAAAHALADRDRGVVDLQTLVRTKADGKILLGPEFETDSAARSFRKRELETLEAKCLHAITDLHEARPCRPIVEMTDLVARLRPAPDVLVDAVIKRLISADVLHRRADGVSLANRDPLDSMSADQRAAYHAADRRLSDMGLHPVALFDAVTEEAFDLEVLLIDKGRAVRLFNHSLKQSLLLSVDAIDEGQKRLAKAFPNGTPFTTSAARQVLETNRKTIVPLLEYYDRLGITERTEDVRTMRYSATENATGMP